MAKRAKVTLSVEGEKPFIGGEGATTEEASADFGRRCRKAVRDVRKARAAGMPLPRTTPNVVAPERAAVVDGDKSLAVAAEDLRQLVQWIIERVPEHAHLKEARIVVLAREGAKMNADGILELGKARKASTLVRLGLERADFVLSFNADRWEALGPQERAALVDHEISHCGVTVAGKYVAQKNLAGFVAALGADHIETCLQMTDNRGRILVRYRRRNEETGRLAWRIRKHDIEEFGAVLARWGRASLGGQRIGPIVDEWDEADDGQMQLPMEGGEAAKGGKEDAA